MTKLQQILRRPFVTYSPPEVDGILLVVSVKDAVEEAEFTDWLMGKINGELAPEPAPARPVPGGGKGCEGVVLND